MADWCWFMMIAGLSLFGCGPTGEARPMTDQLITAAEQGDTTNLRRLILSGVNLNARDSRGRTALMAATHTNQIEPVQILLEAGADVDIQDGQLDNPFLYAGAEGLFEILKLTIAAGADPTLTNRFGGTALIPAAERGHVAVVRELLTTTGVDVNHINNLGWTALLEAIILSDGGENHQQIIRLLIDHGADVHIPDHNGVSPLQHARQRGFRAIEQILLEAGAR
jgi:ankyrin repeat protein